MIINYAVYLTLLIVIVIISIFLFILYKSSQLEQTSVVSAFFYSIRKKYFFFIISIIFISLFFVFNNITFYNPSNNNDKQFISVTAKKWLWQIKKEKFNQSHLFSSTTENIELSADKEIEFQVSSADVNHGLGIYNNKGELIAQVQVMPNHVHRLSLNIKKPGIYQILCMEYCGVGHHIMQAFFKVK